jgi:thiamine-phosphate pyrophosphorylase
MLRRALQVYAITPDRWDSPAEYVAAVGVALRAGVTAVQFRTKRERDASQRHACAAAVRDLCARHGALFVVNDDVDLAIDLDADAVHVGPHDAPVAEVRTRCGEGLWIGSSCGDVRTACALIEAGADYLGVGAIFDASGTKPDAHHGRGLEVLRELRAEPRLVDVPLVAIGGITADRAAPCLGAGADGVAAVRDLLGARDVYAATCAFVHATSLQRGHDKRAPKA